jgi:excisionase family DNA binding protein
MKHNVIPQSLKMRDAARYLGCSPRTLRLLVQRGEIRPRRLSDGPRPGLLFPIAELDRWLAEGPPPANGNGTRR